MNRHGRAGKRGFDPKVVMDYIDARSEYHHNGNLARVNRKKITHDERRQLRRWRRIAEQRYIERSRISPLAVERFLARVRLSSTALKRWADRNDRELIPK